MNVTCVSLFLTACLALLTQTVLSSPAGFVEDINASTVRGRVAADKDHFNMFRKRREAVAAQTDEAQDINVDEEALLSRFRRQVAQMAAVSRRRYSSNYGRRGSTGRLRGRQRYHRERAGRSNNVHNW